jgi:hypothetical protein
VLRSRRTALGPSYCKPAGGSPFDIGAGGLVVLLEECAAALDDVVGLSGALAVCRPGRPASRRGRLTGGPPEIPRGYDA